MEYFEVVPAEDYEWVNFVDKSYYDIFRALSGQPPIEGWKVPVVKMVKADKRTKAKRSDFPWLGSLLILRESALKPLENLLLTNGSLLELGTESGDRLFAHNTRVIEDVLDEEKSVIVRFPDSQRIISIKKLVARASALKEVDVFRLPLRSSGTYVSSKFVEICRGFGLEGLDFHPVDLS